MEDILHEYGVADKFYITGEVVDAIKYVTLFNVAVMTSRWEGFGLVLPEYMIARKPIIAFDVDAVSEIIQDGINGLLIPSEDTDALTNTIINLYNHPKTISHLVKNGYKIVNEKFSINRVASEHDLLFQELLYNKKK